MNENMERMKVEYRAHRASEPCIERISHTLMVTRTTELSPFKTGLSIVASLLMALVISLDAVPSFAEGL